MNTLRKVASAIKEISRSATLEIALDNSDFGKKLFQSFTSRHPKYLIIRKKTTGVAIVKLQDFDDQAGYTKSVNGKNSAAYFSRKAVKSGYTFKGIDPNELGDEIFSINNSALSRQGKEMDDSYKNKFGRYPVNQHNSYFGIFSEKELVAYLWVINTGELAIVNRILGHAEHLEAGIMYLMVTSYISTLFTRGGETKYVMYDTFFGATDGLKLFKKRCGFHPYKINWKISK